MIPLEIAKYGIYIMLCTLEGLNLGYVYTVAFLLLIRTLIVTDTASVYTATAETQPKTQ